MEGIFYAARVLHHVNCTLLPPTKLITDSFRASMVNPEYEDWLRLDKYLRPCLTGSLSPLVMSQMMFLHTTHEI